MARRLRRPLWRSLVFALLPLAIGWLGLEAIALVWFLPSLRGQQPKPRLLYGPHPYRSHTAVPHAGSENSRIWHNGYGLRGAEIPLDKPPGTIRILCHGGSTTYDNAAISDDRTYPAFMERFLREHYAGQPFQIEVINAGVPAFSSLDSLVFFQTFTLQFSPDIVIVLSGINDAWVGAHFRELTGDYSHARHTFGPRRPSLWEYSPFLTILLPKARSAFNPYRPNRSMNLMQLIHYPWEAFPSMDEAAHRMRPQKCAETFGRNLRSFIAVARGNGIIPVLSTEPYRPTDSFYEENVLACNDRTRRIAAHESVALLDLAVELPWNPRVFYDDCHLRDIPEGIEQKGRTFADFLIREKIIEQAVAAWSKTSTKP